MATKVKLGGNWYTVNPGAAFRLNEIQDILGIDIIKDADKFNTDPSWGLSLFQTKEKQAAILTVLLDDCDENAINRTTIVQIIKLMTRFFREALESELEFSDEPPPSGATEKKDEDSNLHTDTPSTLSSGAQAEAT